MQLAGKDVLLWTGKTENAPLVILHTGEAGEGQAVYQAAHSLTDADFSLAAIGGLDWDGELSPWPAPSVGKGFPAFAGKADLYLRSLVEEILPALEASLPHPPACRILAGYSLAGLFALYALYRTDRFARAVSASGSLWYPGFCDFVERHSPCRPPDKLYFSLGDREAKAKNPVLQTVQSSMERVFDWYRRLGVPTVFELNPGNHFQDTVLRTARGITWILEDS